MMDGASLIAKINIDTLLCQGDTEIHGVRNARFLQPLYMSGRPPGQFFLRNAEEHQFFIQS